MLAVVGYLVTYNGVRFPGAEDIPCGFAALDNLPDMVRNLFIITVLVIILLLFSRLCFRYHVGLGADDRNVDDDGSC
jgi:hypothetical protein